MSHRARLTGLVQNGTLVGTYFVLQKEHTAKYAYVSHTTAHIPLMTA